ncbi:hypothetical protein DL96DRAFT_1705612 [Flagelloscypha sp. PMI_526]|nr:hypothetical protein DL96DRAFT_1705612 [Flagelloscypha sp. PMI_526]
MAKKQPKNNQKGRAQRAYSTVLGRVALADLAPSPAPLPFRGSLFLSHFRYLSPYKMLSVISSLPPDALYSRTGEMFSLSSHFIPLTTSALQLVLSDPEENTRRLTEQLKALGLYAADTQGDGNCLFRALSDQIYGTESRHAPLRAAICDYIAANKEKYGPFVEDERGIDVHLRCMRENGTYGGHLELVAFSHMSHRNMKIIQPELVMFIEWESGRADDDEQPQLEIDESVPETVYVAYHSWEHFSSVRNLRGPHAGIPVAQESPAPQVSSSSQPPAESPSRPKKLPKVKLKLSAPQSKPKSKSSAKPVPSTDPTIKPVPLPQLFSRSPSPGLSTVDASSYDASSSSSGFSQEPLSPLTSVGDSRQGTPSPFPPATLESLAPPRLNRSPKRSLDDSDDASTSSGRVKRAKSSLAKSPSPVSSLTSFEDDEDVLEDTATPALSADGSTSTSSSEAPEVVEEEEERSPSPPQRLTRRQRKALGLPKPRPGLSAGKIIIPGGRYHLRHQAHHNNATATPPSEDSEWQRNGAGRMDVRGFRELKI